MGVPEEVFVEGVDVKMFGALIGDIIGSTRKYRRWKNRGYQLFPSGKVLGMFRKEIR